MEKAFIFIFKPKRSKIGASAVGLSPCSDDGRPQKNERMVDYMTKAELLKEFDKLQKKKEYVLRAYTAIVIKAQ